MDALISLGPYYNRTIGQTRDAVRRSREAGLTTMKIYLTAPIVAPIIEVAVTPGRVWVLGFKVLNAPTWWEFKRTGDLPPVPGPASPVQGPAASYELLGLGEFAKATPPVHVIEPWRLLQALATFNGKIGTNAKRKNIVLLLFLVSEAVRFDSMQGLCYRYVSHAEQYFRAPDFYYRNKSALTAHTFDFTWTVRRDGREMAVGEIVDSWRRSAEAGSRDVVLLPG